MTGPGIESIESNLFIGNMDFANFVESADSDGVYRSIARQIDTPQCQHLPAATLRAGVTLRLDLPLFTELLHDLNTDDHGDMILLDSPVDLERYRENVRKQPVREGWRSKGKEEFLRMIDDLSATAGIHLSVYDRYGWNIMLDPDTLAPLAAYKEVRNHPST